MPAVLGALGMEVRQEGRGVKPDMDALGREIERNRAEVGKLVENKEEVDGSLPVWML